MVEDWGTAGERQRRQQRRQWLRLTFAGALMAPIAVAFVLGIVDGYSDYGAPASNPDSQPHIADLGLATAMLVAVAVQYRVWRAADEVERAQINIAFGLSGIVAMSTLPVLSLAATPLSLSNPAMLGWGLAVATLIGTRIVQRLRG